MEELHHRLLRACRYQLMMASERLARVSIATASAKLRDTLGRRQQRVDELCSSAWRAPGRVSVNEHQRACSDSTRECCGMTPRTSCALSKTWCARWTADWCAARSTRSKRPARASRLSLRGCKGFLRSQSWDAGTRWYSTKAAPLVRDAAKTKPGDRLTTRLAKGSVTSTVFDTNL